MVCPKWKKFQIQNWKLNRLINWKILMPILGSKQLVCTPLHDTRLHIKTLCTWKTWISWQSIHLFQLFCHSYITYPEHQKDTASPQRCATKGTYGEYLISLTMKYICFVKFAMLTSETIAILTISSSVDWVGDPQNEDSDTGNINQWIKIMSSMSHKLHKN